MNAVFLNKMENFFIGIILNVIHAHPSEINITKQIVQGAHNEATRNKEVIKRKLWGKSLNDLRDADD